MDPTNLADLAGLLPDPVVVVGPDATITWANAAAERIFGLRRDEVVGHPIEIRVRAADGWRLVELVGAPIGDGAVALCLRDLTDRRRYEIAHGEEARFRSLVHNAGAITMLVSAEGIVESVSAAITR